MEDVVKDTGEQSDEETRSEARGSGVQDPVPVGLGASPFRRGCAATVLLGLRGFLWGPVHHTHLRPQPRLPPLWKVGRS